MKALPVSIHFSRTTGTDPRIVRTLTVPLNFSGTRRMRLLSLARDRVVICLWPRHAIGAR